jgi:transcription elongation factor Elf1
MRVARESTELPKPCLCPVCGDVLSASTALEHVDCKPRSGDYAMCLHCGTILIYACTMTMRVAEPADLAKLDQDNLKLLMAAQMARRAVVGMFPERQESKH